jgi:hypothetical protein
VITETKGELLAKVCELDSLDKARRLAAGAKLDDLACGFGVSGRAGVGYANYVGVSEMKGKCREETEVAERQGVAPCKS